MKNLVFCYIIALSLNFVALASQDKYQAFSSAIINNEQTMAQEMLERSINPATCLNEQGMLCISLALQSKNIPMAQLLTKTIASKIAQQKRRGTEWENPLAHAFQYAAEQHDTETIDTLMQLEMPKYIKTIGCGIAFTTGCNNNDTVLIKKLFTSCAEYIENPCFNATFQWAAICFPEKHSELLDIVLTHPKGISSLEYIIASNHMTYAERKGEYFSLLDKYKNLN